MEPAMRNYLKNVARTKLRGHQAGLSGKSPAAAIRRFRKSAPPRKPNQSQKKAARNIFYSERSRPPANEDVVRHGSPLRNRTSLVFSSSTKKELRNTREGRAYLRLELGDRSGTIEARMWDQFENVAKDIKPRRFS